MFDFAAIPLVAIGAVLLVGAGLVHGLRAEILLRRYMPAIPPGLLPLAGGLAGVVTVALWFT